MVVSIITVCYHSVTTLATAIESVLEQTYPNIEYIVVDGGSKDGTVKIAKEYIRKFEAKSYKMKVLSEPDEGMYDAINKGIRMATGDVIGILNADDFLADDKVVERMANTFLTQAIEKIDVVYGDVRFVREVKNEKLKAKSEESSQIRQSGNQDSLERSGNHSATAESEALIRQSACELTSLRNANTLRNYSAKHWKPWMLQWGFMPPHPGVYIRRELFEKLGYYKLGYHIAADYELLIRYLRKGWLNIRYLDVCVVGMRPGGKSTKNWRSNVLLNQEIVRGNRENGCFCCMCMLIPKYLFKIWEFILPRMCRRVEAEQAC